MSMDIEEIAIRVSGLQVAGRACGPRDGYPVLCMHGWLDNAASLEPLLALLPASFRFVALDLPGHGRSEHKSEDASYHFVDWVASVVDAADALGFGRFSILAHSMGAAIATMVAPVIAERVERMVLIDGLGPWTLPGECAPEQLRRALSARAVLGSKSARRFENIEQAVAVLNQSYADLSPQNVRRIVERGSRQLADGGLSFSYDLRLRGASMMRLSEEQVRAFLAEIGCPVLMVRPLQGWPLDAETFAARFEAIKGARLLEVEGGHHVHLEAPERMAEAIGAFLLEGQP
ncbi:MAG: alpha/beta hydrolase [Bradymonadaceae bacterium]|nr:alpha/beta hydrolase [Lujinxingiaceae bacterium]